VYSIIGAIDNNARDVDGTFSVSLSRDHFGRTCSSKFNSPVFKVKIDSPDSLFLEYASNALALPFSKFSLLTIFSVQSLPLVSSLLSSSSSVETTFSEWKDDDDELFVLILLNTDLFFAAQAAVRVFFAARKELDFAAKERGKSLLPGVVIVVEKEQEQEQEEKEENPTVPRSIKRSPRSARKEEVERGIMIRFVFAF
jgi:hypothetical protein|tara:strand:- start:3249 stop:3842 length:594 start_codon:yes stop_codon:yes gene_type:complete